MIDLHESIQDHECNDDGKGQHTFYNSDKILTTEEYNNLTQEEIEKMNPRSGSATCSICESVAIDRFNPFFME